jgi:tetratricopeptide (TPR) repeat protein
MQNLAAFLIEAGQMEEGEAVLREVLRIEEQTFEPDDPDLLYTKSNLGGVLMSQRRFAEAEVHFRELLELQRRVSGPKHPDTIGAMNNVGGAIKNQGKFAEAIAIYEAAWKLAVEVLGKGHPDTLKTLSNYAYALRDLGSIEDAEQLFLQALGTAEQSLGHQHWITGGLHRDVARCLVMQQRFLEAEAHFVSCFEIWTVLSEDDRRKISLIKDMEALYESLNRPDEAAKYRQMLTPASATTQPATAPARQTSLMSA